MTPEEAIRLRRAIDRLARELNGSATDEGLTPTQASVLGLVATRGPLGIGELVEVERFNPTLLSRVIGKLADADLIHRTPDPDDKRAVNLTVTPDGRRTQERIKAQRTEILSNCMARIDPQLADSVTGAIAGLEALVDELRQRP